MDPVWAEVDFSEPSTAYRFFYILKYIHHQKLFDSLKTCSKNVLIIEIYFLFFFILISINAGYIGVGSNDI